MNDGPTPDDFRAKVFRDRKHTGDWRVEKLLDDGESSEVAIFSGGDARQRAIRYADREYGAFDEIELEPYNYLRLLTLVITESAEDRCFPLRAPVRGKSNAG